MQADAKKHLLRRFHRNMIQRLNAVTLQKEIQPGESEKRIPFLIHVGGCFIQFLSAVAFQDIGTVQAFLRQIADLLIEAADPFPLHMSIQRPAEAIV